jgi:hypothetical protein
MRRFAFLIFAAQLLSLAQIGPYPGGTYPPGQYPGPTGGGSGLPFPWPRGGKKGGSDSKAPAEKVSRTTGKLSKIDEKSISMEAEDRRVLVFRRNSSTKFYKESQEIKAAELKSGDQISVEATEDQEGYLYARNVYLQAAAETAKEQGPEDEKTPATTLSPPPAPRDRDDPGPPMLRRGTPVKRQTPEAEPAGTPAQVAQAPAQPADAYIEKARAAAESFSEKLPDYICKEFMTRYAGTSRPVNWRALDVVSMDIVYQDGRERYQNVAVNGKATHKEIDQIGGAWSTGEFATVLRDLFSPATAADFRFRRTSSAGGAEARVYDFEVSQANSHWHVEVASQSINPAYKGSVWIAPASGRVLRIEMQARQLPREFPMDTVESAVDYENVRIGSAQFLLPVHSENLSCQRGTSNCSRIVIDFRNYHKYSADSSVEFGATN